MSTTHDHRQSRADSIATPQVSFEAEHDPTVSRRASNAQLGAIQMKLGGQATEGVHDAASRGVSSPETSLPHADKIQQSFGAAHDVSGIRAHVGGDSAKAMGATAFASGNHVVFDKSPDLHTAAHEAAHVVQQAKGVNLYGGVGEAGDSYETHADAVADRVVSGQSAADLLSGGPSSGGATNAVQRKEVIGPDNTEAHDKADSTAGNAYADRLHMLALHMYSAAESIDGQRMAAQAIQADPSKGNEAGLSPMIMMINEDIAKIDDESDDLRASALRQGSLSMAQKTEMHKDLGIVEGAWMVYMAAVIHAKNWNSEVENKNDSTQRHLTNLYGAFGLTPQEVPRLGRSQERIADLDAEGAENQAIHSTIATIQASAAALKLNRKASADGELSGDMLKLTDALRSAHELLEKTSLATRVRKSKTLEVAMKAVYDVHTDLNSSNPALGKSLDAAANDVIWLNSFVRQHSKK